MSLPVRDQAQRRPAFAPLGPVKTHYWRVLRMARATGTDLVKAEIAPADWARMVQCCRGCDWSQGCARWLDSVRDDGRPVPDGCANKRQLEILGAVRDSVVAD